jgi:demethoxyubiquinone hydroxylase (CLK1/Coq7/Cat5 family)
VRAARARKRSIVALAVENAVEGCVNETWAALMALHQAAEAREPDVRAALAEIATDEVRHAELARAVHDWLQPRLTAPERARVARARSAAIARIAHSTYPGVLGLPDRARLQALHAGMVRTVWSAPCA